MTPSFRATVSAAAAVRFDLAQLNALRADPGSFRGKALGPLLRQSDELTLVEATAVLRAIESAGWQDRSFANWGIAASVRAIGRIKFASSISRYRKMQARGVSPLHIPHLSLHAASSTLSILLGTHGPNFGVGGVESHLAEALVLALTSAQDEATDGYWIVSAEFDPQPTLDAEGQPINQPIVHAVALAVSREAIGEQSNTLEISLTQGQGEPSRLPALVDWLNSDGAFSWRADLPGAGVIELRRAASSQLRKAS